MPLRKIINKDPSSDHQADVSHFGVLKAGPTILTVKANFPGSTLKPQRWVETIANGGTNTVQDGYVAIKPSTNTAGSAKLESVEYGRFEAGQVTVWQSGVYAGAGVASNNRYWGLISKDGNDGLYFKWSGTTFQVVAKKGGTETTVNSASFNGENDWTPGASNSTYRIEYSAGRAIFYRAGAGKKVLLHEMVDTDEPLVSTLDLRTYYENTNAGSSTDVEMRVRGMSISIWGHDPGVDNVRVAYEEQNINSKKYIILIDLSDTTNFPHGTATNRIDIEQLKIAIERDTNAAGSVDVGVITDIDGTDAEISYLFSVPFTKSDTRRILSINDFMGRNRLKFGVSENALTHALVNTTESAITAVNTGVTLDSPRGSSTVTPAVGDVIVRLDRTAGTYDFLIEANYHSE